MHETASAAHPRLQHHFESLEQQKESSVLGMWTFLLTEVMFFGGLFLVYTVYRAMYGEAFAEASRHLNIPIGLVNTVVLIGSSFTMALAVHAAALGRPRATSLWLIATALLGLVFLGVKVGEYQEKFAHHFVPGPHFDPLPDAAHPERKPTFAPEHRAGAEAYFSLYFAMTGLHATHMIIGIPILLILAFMAYRGQFSRAYSTPVEMFGLYWHFVDIIWIFLFPLLYLIDPSRHH